MTFQTLEFFVTFFSGTVRPRRLKIGTHMDSGQMYHVYRNQAAASYSSLYFFIFLSLQFSSLTVDSGQMYRVYGNQAAAAYLSLYSSFFFLTNYQTLKIFVTLFLRNCEA